MFWMYCSTFNVPVDALFLCIIISDGQSTLNSLQMMTDGWQMTIVPIVFCKLNSPCMWIIHNLLSVSWLLCFAFLILETLLTVIHWLLLKAIRRWNYRWILIFNFCIYNIILYYFTHKVYYYHSSYIIIVLSYYFHTFNR